MVLGRNLRSEEVFQHRHKFVGHIFRTMELRLGQSGLFYIADPEGGSITLSLRSYASPDSAHLADLVGSSGEDGAEEGDTKSTVATQKGVVLRVIFMDNFE